MKFDVYFQETPKRRVLIVADIASNPMKLGPDVMGALIRQYQKQRRPLTCEHAEHIIAEYSVRPEFPPFP